MVKSLAYLFTFYAAPFRVLSWLTDDSFHDLNIEKQSGEEMVVRIYFAEMT